RVALDPCFRFTRHVRRSDGGPRISRSPQVLQGSPHRGMIKNRLPGPTNWSLCWTDRSSQRAIGTFTTPIPTFWVVAQLLSPGSGATIN
ncbi:hypothetical protein CORC01_03498, partial [Colletotrichum orchidophilum]